MDLAVLDSSQKELTELDHLITARGVAMEGITITTLHYAITNTTQQNHNHNHNHNTDTTQHNTNTTQVLEYRHY